MEKGFALLKGEQVEYYIQALSITIGRYHENNQKLRKNSKQKIDLELGKLKNISRVHAKISFNFKLKKFEIKCYSKNGIKINNEYFSKNDPPQVIEDDSIVKLYILISNQY